MEEFFNIFPVNVIEKILLFNKLIFLCELNKEYHQKFESQVIKEQYGLKKVVNAKSASLKESI